MLGEVFRADNNGVIDWIQNAGAFEIEQGDFYNTGKLIPAGQGDFLIKHSFK